MASIWFVAPYLYCMDNSRIIADILNEWALYSEDGLAGGYDTPQNICALETALLEYGIPAKEAELVIECMFGPKTVKSLKK